MDNSFIGSVGSLGAGFIMDSAKSVVNAGLQDSLNERANKRTLENMVVGNKMARANFMDSAGLQKVGAVRAGMSPLGSYQSTNITPSSPSSPSGSFVSGSGSASDIVNAQRLQNEIDVVKSEIDKNTADAELARANARKIGFEGDFLGDTLDSRIKLTNKENVNKYYIEGYFEEHPQLLQEVAKAQTLLNNKVRSEIDVNKENISVLKSIVSKNESEISLNDAKKALTIIQTTLTKEQIAVLKDENFRNNMNNYGYLLDQIANVAKSDLDDSSKSEKISLLKDVLGYVSGVTLKEKEFGYQKFLQARDLSVKQDIANKDRAVNKQRADAISQMADTQQLKVESDIVFHTIELFVDIIDRIFKAIPSLIKSFF